MIGLACLLDEKPLFLVWPSFILLWIALVFVLRRLDYYSIEKLRSLCSPPAVCIGCTLVGSTVAGYK